jgi:hypothetical protein
MNLDGDLEDLRSELPESCGAGHRCEPDYPARSVRAGRPGSRIDAEPRAGHIHHSTTVPGCL